MVRRPSRFEEVDAVALGERDNGPLGIGALAEGERAPIALALSLPVQRVHLRDTHAEKALNRLANLDLVGARVHNERVDALVEQAIRLLADDRPDNHVTGIIHADTSASSAGAAGAAGAAAVGSDPAPGSVA